MPDVDLYVSPCIGIELPDEDADESEVRLPLLLFLRWVNLIGWAGLAVGNMQFIAPDDEPCSPRVSPGNVGAPRPNGSGTGSRRGSWPCWPVSRCSRACGKDEPKRSALAESLAQLCEQARADTEARPAVGERLRRDEPTAARGFGSPRTSRS